MKDIERALNLIRSQQATFELDAIERGDDRLLKDWSYGVAAALWPLAPAAFTERPAPYDLADAVKWFYHLLRSTTEWTLDAIADRSQVDLDVETDAIYGLTRRLFEAIRHLVPNLSTYSDGRQVQTRAQIENGHAYYHLWHPDPEKDVPTEFHGKLLADPGEDNGGYTLRVVPPQTLLVEIHPPGPSLRLVPKTEDGAQ